MLRRFVISCASFTTSKIVGSHSGIHGHHANFLNFAHNALWVSTVFIIGGIIHIGGDYMLLGRFGSDTLKFFVLQPVAIILEKAVAFGWSLFNPPDGSDARTNRSKGHNDLKSLSDNTSKDGKRLRSGLETKIVSEPPMWLRCVGYIWVFLWFVLSLPFTIDPLVSLGIFTDPRVDLRIFTWAS
jgi:hypothetical protein